MRYVRSFRFLAPVILLLYAARLPADEPKVIDEDWDAVYMQGEKIGYVHSIVSKIQDKDRTVIHVKAESVMSLKRFGQAVDMKSELNTFESEDGKLIRFETRTLASRVEMSSRGEVAGDEMRLTIKSLGKETSQTIPWSSDVVAPYAEDKLKDQKLEAGQTRVYKSFVPDLNRIATITLIGDSPEETQLLNSSRKLRKLRSELRLETEKPPFIRGVEWIDDSNDTLKSFVDTMNMTTYRVSKDIALAKPAEIQRDIGINTLIKVARKVPKPYDATEIVYEVSMTEAKIEDTFPQDLHQSLSKTDDGKSLLTVRWVDPAGSDASAKPADSEFLRSNNYLQTEHAKIKEFAAAAVAKETDPWKKALLLEKWVAKNLTQKNFSVAMATAAEVAENLAGDCTEHAVLLSAMARASGIPSRVAVGLLYVDQLSAFGGHMWSEVYINGRWVPLDGTLGRGFVGGTHVKLADSSLDGADAMVAFVPVVRVFGNLKVDAVSWRHPK